ncbi:MAG: hypothetical protein ACYCZR_01140 [Burkholderiales bacterium]
MADSLAMMIDDLRGHRPKIYDVDAWARWESAIVQTIAALPTEERQWAAIVLVANDLFAEMPGLPLQMAYRFLCGKVKAYHAKGVQS